MHFIPHNCWQLCPQMFLNTVLAKATSALKATGFCQSWAAGSCIALPQLHQWPRREIHSPSFGCLEVTCLVWTHHPGCLSAVRQERSVSRENPSHPETDVSHTPGVNCPWGHLPLQWKLGEPSLLSGNLMSKQIKSGEINLLPKL